MPEMNTIYDAQGNVIGIFRFGVAWESKTNKRLGEYHENSIYDNNKNKIAESKGNEVYNITGHKLGEVINQQLFVNDNAVGKCIGSQEAATAAIALLFSSNTRNTHNK